MGRREDTDFVLLADHVAGERVDVVQRVHLVAEELDADCHFLVCGNDVHRVALDAEGAALEVDVVAFVLHVYQQAQEAIALHFFAHAQHDRSVQVRLRGTQAVDARNRGHDDNVAARQQRRRGRVAQPLHVVVDGRIFLDVRVRLRDVRLGLVVVVVGHEVLHRVVRQQLPQLVCELGRQCLIRRHHERGALLLLNQPSRGRGLAGACRTHEHDVAFTAVEPLVELSDRMRLVARRLVLGDNFEWLLAPLDLAHWAEFGLREDRVFSSKSHGE